MEEHRNGSMRSLTGAALCLSASILLFSAFLAPLPAQEDSSGIPRINLRDAGYYLWEDAEGWHVITVSGGQGRSFSGEIKVTNGVIEEVRPRDRVMRDEDITLLDAHTITFSYQTKQDLLGFDFKNRGESPCVSFDLKIDSRALKRSIFLGGGKLMPAQVPFSICK
jgi:hypothetical protein